MRVADYIKWYNRPNVVHDEAGRSASKEIATDDRDAIGLSQSLSVSTRRPATWKHTEPHGSGFLRPIVG